jgi:RHS repeat-associated protein
MSGISSKALNNSPQNRYKFNGGNELQSGEFTDGSGLELYDAVNRGYDPQIGRFWQVDELAEANWEWTPYNFAINNPISFNDPLGLKEGPNDVKTLQEVVVTGKRKLTHNQMQSIYWQMRDQGMDFSRIKSDALRERLVRWDLIQRRMDRVHEMIREQDKVVLEVGSYFMPMGWLTKLKYVRNAINLFKWKRGNAVANIAEEAAEQVIRYGDEAAKGENVVYHSIEDGVTQYVGITNNFARREAAHLAQKGIKIEPLMQGVSRSDARAVEQALIEIHGLGKNGGTLINKINSIATSNPAYSSQLKRGYELLQSIGYK